MHEDGEIISFEDLCSIIPDPPQMRDKCSSCHRPTTVCWCPFLPDQKIQIKSTLLVLQHPGEVKKCLRTAPILERSLESKNFKIFRGKRFPGKHVMLHSVLDFPNTLLLYPAPDAIPIDTLDASVHYNIQTIEALNGLQSNASVIQKSQFAVDKQQHGENSLRDSFKFLKAAELTENDLDQLSIIHVTGTKGKGSTCAFTESILRHYGLTTGFFSSPHLIAVRERIRINGVPLDVNQFTEHFWKLYDKLYAKREHEKDMPPYFKFLTLMAFQVFLEKKVDVAIIEVGVGGQYDCTNVIRMLDQIFGLGTSNIKLHTNTNKIRLEKGVRQGDSISPKLFTACLENVFRGLNWTSKGILINGDRQTNLRFADDVVLFSESPQELQLMVEELRTASSKVGLEINLSKTKVMFNRNVEIQPIMTGNVALDQVDRYIYLGQLISIHRDWEPEVRRRVALGWQAFGRLNNVWSSKLPLCLKRKVYDQCVLSVLTHPVVCGVSSLDIDHVNVLGNTIEEIAWNKGGIFKEGAPAFTVPQPPQAMQVLMQRAAERRATLHLCPELSTYDWNQMPIKLGLAGKAQFLNATLALQISNAWLKLTGKCKFSPFFFNFLPYLNVDDTFNLDFPPLVAPFKISPIMYSGLMQCMWAGRSQTIQNGSVTYFLDGAHTADSMKNCVDWFKESSIVQNTKTSDICRVLIYNSTGARDPGPLLIPLSAVGFDLVIFCPNLVSLNTNASSDQANLMTPEVTQLNKCKTNQQFWSYLESSALEQQKATEYENNNYVISSTTTTDMNYIFKESPESFEERPEKLANSEKVHILVTGSLHLVGGVLALLDPELKTQIPKPIPLDVSDIS
ncbi:Folylpolyglutamate synthase, mitochondrial [Nymphon striatum]|nr:Folylpolyglutamate synthase, mitochondrial [Nymphon striatum]